MEPEDRRDLRVRLYQLAPIALLSLDDKGLIREANDSAARLLERDGSTLAGKPFIVAARMDDASLFWRGFERWLAGEPRVVELLFFTARGTRRLVEALGAPTGDGYGRGGCVVTLVDITERKRAHEEARLAHAAEARLRARLETLVGAHAAIGEALSELPQSGLAGVLQTIAEQARHLADSEFAAVGLGGSRGEAFSHWAQSGPDEEPGTGEREPPRALGLLALVSARGATIRTRDMSRHAAYRGLPPGFPPPTSFLGVPLRYRGGSLGGLYLATKRAAPEFDEEDQRFASMLAVRAALAIDTAIAAGAEAERRSWLQKVLDQMPEGVAVADAAGRVSLNSRAREYVRAVEGADAEGTPAIAIEARKIGGERIPTAEDPLHRAMERGETTRQVELLLGTWDGRQVPVLASASPVADAQGRRLGAVAVFQDVSALKRLERLREEWSAVVAHDLRQPLATIQMTDELLARTTDPAAVDARLLARIRGAAERMAAMIDELVDSSMLEARQLRLVRRRLAVKELVSEVAEQFGLQHPDRPVVVEAADDVPAIDGDRARIEQVLLNLLSNARKYGRPATPIRLAAHPSADGVELAVTNEGEPLAAAEVDRLFSRFYRTNGARRSRAGGLGLGLYIVKGLVEAHGGRVQVRSDHGETTFAVTLPRARPSDAG